MGCGKLGGRRAAKLALLPDYMGGRKMFFLCGLGMGLGGNWLMDFEDKHDISGSVCPPPLEGLF